MLNHMIIKEQAIDALMTQAKEVASLMDNEDAAQFYSELADKAYLQFEAMSIDDECEMQNYEEE